MIGCKSDLEQRNSRRRWVPYNKGGEFRKWYGNNEYVVNWKNGGKEIKEATLIAYPQLTPENMGWKISNESYYYRKGITWSGSLLGRLAVVVTKRDLFSIREQMDCLRPRNVIDTFGRSVEYKLG